MEVSRYSRSFNLESEVNRYLSLQSALIILIILYQRLSTSSTALLIVFELMIVLWTYLININTTLSMSFNQFSSQ